MREYLPLLIIGASIGVFSMLFLGGYYILKKKKLTGFERNMSDTELLGRLMAYAKPYWKSLLLVLVITGVSIVYSLVSPLLVGHIEEMVSGEFRLSELFAVVAVYAALLIVSVICTYFQAIILQRTGQRILSQIRLDLFAKIEQLSHQQFHNMPVGKLVTRITNDPNSISYMVTNIAVTLVKNVMVVVGVLVAMLILNYALTLMVLCFVPFLVLFTYIFRKFSRTVHRGVTDATTDINTYLSENLSGMKITQIFGQESAKMDQFQQRSYKLKKAKMGRMFVFGIFRPMVQMLNVSAVLCLL